MMEKSPGQQEHAHAVLNTEIIPVSTTIAALDGWLDQARRLFAGPVDISCMALGTVLIAFAVWGRLFDPKTWSAPEFLGLLSLAAILFVSASIERMAVARAHQNSDVILKQIRAELADTIGVIPQRAQDLNGKRKRRWLVWG